jgi:hypothetical protein
LMLLTEASDVRLELTKSKSSNSGLSKMMPSGSQPRVKADVSVPANDLVDIVVSGPITIGSDAQVINCVFDTAR